jgi:hypothetical protein
MERKPVVLLLTATITPSAEVPGLIRTDPAVRLEDYCSALDFYLGLLGLGIDRIVFAENSNSDLSRLRDLVQRRGEVERVEFLPHDGLDFPPAYGRCYGEMRLLDYAMAHSGTIRRCGPSCIVWKVTGRYKVLNLPALIRKQPREFDVYCDMRNNGVPWLDMRVMAWTPAGYGKILRGIHEQIWEEGYRGHAGEASMYREVSEKLGQGRVVATYSVEPRISGRRAFDNKDWSHGRQWLVYHIRAWQRTFLGKVLW